MNERSAIVALHVLLVDDHSRLRKILQMALESDGFRVTAVESADEAVTLLANGTMVDILFSDIRMPGSIDGLQLARWAREHRPEIAILLQTGFSDLDTGDFPVLRKPYPPEELSARLHAIVADDCAWTERCPQAAAVIVGAGAAGLSAAAALQRRGIDPVVLEQDSALGATWARRYDGLHLHTVRAHSGLAHYPIPGRGPKYLSRDEYVAYLKDYADHFRLRIVANYTVRRVRMEAETPIAWHISGVRAHWRAPVVILATGQYRVPRVPALPGLESYTGVFTHSVNYRNASSYVGKRVLVVGLGNSGAEIATQLVEQGASLVAMSIRTTPPIVPRDPFGSPVQRTSILLSVLPPRLADLLGKMTSRLLLGDLSRYGLPNADWRPYSSGRVPVIDVGFVDVVKRGLLQIRPELVRLTPTQAVYADGRSEPFDAIIAATGFTTGLDSLLETSQALNHLNEPADSAGEPTSCPGLFFIGFTHSLRGHLFEANRASRKLAANVDRYLQHASPISG